MGEGRKRGWSEREGAEKGGRVIYWNWGDFDHFSTSTRGGEKSESWESIKKSSKTFQF